MDNVELYEFFPTRIYGFQSGLTNYYNDQMLGYLKTPNNSHREENDLHTLSKFKLLKDKVLEVSEYILKSDGYEYEKIEITNMWSTQMQAGAVHAPHTHPNNFLSGVYYVQASKETSPIQFFDPRPQASVLSPRKRPNCHNSNMIQLDSVIGVGLIFPSWLQHWVPQTKDNRISISWNVFVRGEYGEPNTLQNAYI
jgi:uncharacterized protein (TIGR02466 family)